MVGAQKANHYNGQTDKVNRYVVSHLQSVSYIALRMIFLFPFSWIYGVFHYDSSFQNYSLKGLIQNYKLTSLMHI